MPYLALIWKKFTRKSIRKSLFLERDFILCSRARHDIAQHVHSSVICCALKRVILSEAILLTRCGIARRAKKITRKMFVSTLTSMKVHFSEPSSQVIWVLLEKKQEWEWAFYICSAEVVQVFIFITFLLSFLFRSTFRHPSDQRQTNKSYRRGLQMEIAQSFYFDVYHLLVRGYDNLHFEASGQPRPAHRTQHYWNHFFLQLLLRRDSTVSNFDEMEDADDKLDERRSTFSKRWV